MSFTYDANSRSSLGLKSMKSILLAVLMVSMSLSVGLVQLNKAPWLVEDAESELEDINKPMHTTAPSITYSSSTLSLVKNTAMTPTTPTNSGGAFEPQTISSTQAMAQNMQSMALDSNGDSHISMYDYANGKVKYISDSSGSWVDISLVSTDDVGGHNSIAVDSNDAIHIAYFGYLNPSGTGVNNLMYSSCVSSCGTPSSWSTTIIDNSGDVGKWNSIAIDSNNNLHISYYDSANANKDLKYATCSSSCTTASSWSSITVDNVGDVGEYTSMAIDSNDDLHIIYSGAETTGLGSGNSNQEYATCSSVCTTVSSWTITSLNAPEDSIMENSLTIDSNDVLHVAFYDLDLRDLFYSMCASLCTSASSWSTTTIDSANDVGNSPSIGVDSNNVLHISYSANTPDYDMKYAKCISSCSSAPSWSVVTLYSSGHVGFENSLAVNLNDNSVHISFTSWTTSSIYYIDTDSFGYSVSPNLPSGLDLNWADGTISGTPTESSPSTTYTVTAKNSHGSDTTTLTILVPSTPSISYDWGTGSSTSVYSNNKITGHRHTCAILDSGLVSCWGRNSEGQLGNGGLSQLNSPTLTNSLGTGRTAVALSSGVSHTCAILDNGLVSCWGDGTNGRLGNGGTSQQTSPTLTSSLGTGRTAVAISSGMYHTCAILDNGEVSCWGSGGNGRLGNGDTSDKNTPTLTSSLGTGRTAIAIASGFAHTCAILDNGATSCWGVGSVGRLGNGGTSNQNLPTPTSSLGVGRTAVAISGGMFHTCVILDNGSVSCWGDGANGRLGNGGTSVQTSPILTSSLGTGRTAVAISAGGSHTCAILDNGATSCWGVGFNGQLGNGGTSNQNSPTLISNPGVSRTAVAVASGEYHTCAILDDASMKCWGTDSNGQLGNGATNVQQNSPFLVSGSHTWHSTTISGSSRTVYLVQNVAMSTLSPTLTGGTAPTSCTHTGLPNGLALSNSCVLSGTPATLGSTILSISPSNSAGTGIATSIIVNVNASGGSLIINSTSAEGGVGSAISNITMSYTHTASVQNWTSGVTNTTIQPVNTFDDISRHEMDSGLHG
ncbi:MAG: hypothetical protein HOI28_00415, partial [Euryarchaeota archaeon]|nr:hypothetical protein [Euryarchaeota archaeon]